MKIARGAADDAAIIAQHPDRNPDPVDRVKEDRNKKIEGSQSKALSADDVSYEEVKGPVSSTEPINEPQQTKQPETHSQATMNMGDGPGY